jgi:hypothetical protein
MVVNEGSRMCTEYTLSPFDACAAEAAIGVVALLVAVAPLFTLVEI